MNIQISKPIQDVIDEWYAKPMTKCKRYGVKPDASTPNGYMISFESHCTYDIPDKGDLRITFQGDKFNYSKQVVYPIDPNDIVGDTVKIKQILKDFDNEYNTIHKLILDKISIEYSESFLST